MINLASLYIFGFLSNNPSISLNNINKSALTKLSDKSELRIIVDASLDRYEDKMRVEPVSFIHAAQCMVWMYENDFKIPTEHRNIMRVENMTSGEYSSEKKTKSYSLKLEAHRL